MLVVVPFGSRRKRHTSTPTSTINMASEAFKVIIVGGGPTGITAAHALHHAGIDFVVLERREDVTEDLGASLVLSPPSLRVFHQLGILEQLMDIGGKVIDSKGLTVDGQVFKKAATFELLKEKYVVAYPQSPLSIPHCAPHWVVLRDR